MCRAGRRPRPFPDRRRSPRHGRCRLPRRPAAPPAMLGNISCASTPVATGPIWPPASIPSMTSASTPERCSFLASASAGAKQITFAPVRLDRLDAAARRQAAGQHDMADIMPVAHADEIEQHRVHGDEIDAEGRARELFGRNDLCFQQIGRHCPAGDEAEAPGIAHRRDEMALGHPSSSRRTGWRLSSPENPRRVPSGRKGDRSPPECRSSMLPQSVCAAIEPAR